MADTYFNPYTAYGNLLLNFGSSLSDMISQQEDRRLKLASMMEDSSRQQLDDVIQLSNMRAKQAAERVTQLTAQNVWGQIDSMGKNYTGDNVGQAFVQYAQFKSMEKSPGFDKLMSDAPALADHYRQVMAVMDNPVGGRPNFQNIFLNMGRGKDLAKPAGYEDTAKAAALTPADQRETFWQFVGYPLSAIQYDRAAGAPTTTPDKVTEELRAALMAQEKNISIDDARAIQHVGVTSLPVGDKSYSPSEALALARQGNGQVIQSYLTQAPDMAAMGKRLADAGVPVTPGMVEQAMQAKAQNVVSASSTPQQTMTAALGATQYAALAKVLPQVYQPIEGKDAVKTWKEIKGQIDEALPGAKDVAPEAWAQVVGAKPEDRPEAMRNFVIQVKSKVTADANLAGNEAGRSMAALSQAAGLGQNVDLLAANLSGKNGADNQARAMAALKTTQVVDPISGKDVSVADRLRAQESTLRAQAERLAQYEPPRRDEKGNALNPTARAQDLALMAKLLTAPVRIKVMEKPEPTLIDLERERAMSDLQKYNVDLGYPNAGTYYP